MTDPPPNHVVNIDTKKIALILPPDKDYSLVELITEQSSKWEYSISFKGVWGTGGIGREGEKFFADHYDFAKLKKIATNWDLKGHHYSILVCSNPNFMERTYYKFLYIMGEGGYSGTGPIHLTQEDKQQLANGWSISLEKLIPQLPLLKIVSHETPSCSVTRWEEWKLDIELSFPRASTEEKIAKIGEIIAFHNKEIQRVREEYFMTLNTAEERQYYKNVWGFDPAADRLYKWEGKYVVKGEEGLYQYETWFPLLSDPPLHATGVEIGARVQVIRENDSNKIKSQSRIVFRREDEIEAIDCIHIVLTIRPKEEVSNATNIEGLVPNSDEFESASLSAPEHFAALKSYVASIAEMGIIQLLWEAFTAQSDDTEQLRFGFNPEMQMQVMRALEYIAPAAIISIKRDWFMQLVDSTPSEWLSSHLPLLAERGLLRFEIEVIPEIFPSDWLKEHKSRVDDLINTLIELQSPDEDVFRED